MATRLGQRALWQRTLKLERTTLEDVWAGIEDFARDEWRTPAELSTHLAAWLRAHDPRRRGDPRQRRPAATSASVTAA